MIDRHALVKSTLQQHGYSITRPRLAIYDAIEQQHQISLAQLLQHTHGANRASVYRTIDMYEKLGIVQRLQKGKQTILELSDRFGDHHHHLWCTVCGATLAIPGSADIEAALRSAARKAGFVAQTHVIEVSGLCRSCQDSAAGV